MLGLGIIGWIIIGGLAGWIASKFMKTDAQQGIILNIVVGIVGGLLGGFLLKLLGVDVQGVLGDQLADKPAPVGRRMAGPDAECAQFVMPMAQHAFRPFPAQHRHDVGGAEDLVCPVYRR